MANGVVDAALFCTSALTTAHAIPPFKSYSHIVSQTSASQLPALLTMSYSQQRLIPILLATFVGVASGVYIFDAPLKQYKSDTDGTFDPAKRGALSSLTAPRSSDSQIQQPIAEERVAPITKEVRN
ncbi:hypothetical protein K437DRAFT_270721 [Tilletiaria anomala UBC 951]|uniref:Uncharacterized protein n=1 Tax=Tilletiaria anomala (strain ATCC 24038 / CBS 436.72 / UBC 951) TaxID=1037660 RepID=A0A066V898_TILAU|nr:uncharacterized protein K437DRAFT_270721 [Tilletiaria anomala UBC 951]KDN37947.1 hypothetical protein K437DRAFT_270721 [Tilletiaria anomala UBC 951]